ncbi:hypothetical protein AMATHDRAFT_73358 [Amanita thiersii Skay4041]|uniref:EGF-like domain-containing protein n=1 Tax=Amanita thiersii Skay4041 TaxID=703135 RepID=A0A2A9NVY9_9AGAR|nr:hypothetical protein AMATHDRAFT_73358 [Amanita thiersii Skay4041]
MVSSFFPFLLFSLIDASVAAQSLSVICIAGQCIQGISNITMGVDLSAPGAPATLRLLPGTYTSTTNPKLLHDMLISSSPSLSPSVGFGNTSTSAFTSSSSTIKLPLNIELDAGLVLYAQPYYSGHASFSKLPSAPSSANVSVPITALSLSMSPGTWAVVSSTDNQRIILWDSVPDITQLPISPSLALLDLQSSACQPACSGSGVCSSQGICICQEGFTGSSCEQCAPGFFGPNCTRCSEDATNCTKCDDGLTGTGRCLQRANDPKDPETECNCVNGICGSDGQCTCAIGWTRGDDGKACAKCADGFFQTSTGECKVCQLGCIKCADDSGTCTTCKSGFSQDANNPATCKPVQSVTPTGTICPDGSFSDGQKCSPCSPSCRTCTGPTSNDCAICANGSFIFNGSCVKADSNGICEGANGMIADNNKKECDTCGLHCASCKIPNFTVASTVNQAQCTSCIPGYVLSNGQCIKSCPSGSFVSPQDNVTCIPCSPTCSTCAGSADFCLSCPRNGLVFAGKCMNSCPSNTVEGISSNNSRTCLSCHADCATCSGPSFTQCTSCPTLRPVLSNGRCLATCGRGQFLDSGSKSCQSCDPECASCAGPENNQCLSCKGNDRVLHAGLCVAAQCQGSGGLISSLGVCFSNLVAIPEPTGTNSPHGPNGSSIPMPTITGLTEPISDDTKKIRLAWWQILLMALGCAFILLVIILLWRRRARRQRSMRTAKFAQAKGIDGKWWWGHGWRARLARLFGREGPRRRRRDEERSVVGTAKDKRETMTSIRSTIIAPSVHEEQQVGRVNVGKGDSLSLYSELRGEREGQRPRQPVKEGGGQAGQNPFNPFRQ